ncbi:MAG: hypothetical protein KF849_05275 [Rhizobiaceae bacterium]|nr:hypothetical protein [Rhizobiaceae bacterium]
MAYQVAGVVAGGTTAQMNLTEAQLLAFFQASIGAQTGADGTVGNVVWSFDAANADTTTCVVERSR